MLAETVWSCLDDDARGVIPKTPPTEVRSPSGSSHQERCGACGRQELSREGRDTSLPKSKRIASKRCRIERKRK